MKKYILIGILCIVVFSATSTASNLDWVNEMRDRPASVWLDTYDVASLGISWFYTFLFCTIGVGIYLQSKSLALVVGYLLLIFLFGGALLSQMSIMLVVLGIIAGLATTSLLFYALIVKRGV